MYFLRVVVIFILFIELPHFSHSQDYDPYIWSEGGKMLINSDEVIGNIDSVVALIAVCKSNIQGLSESLKNNPQVVELHLYNVTQDILTEIFQVNSPNLLMLFIEDFQELNCIIPKCTNESLFQLHLQSNITEKLISNPNSLNKIEFLTIEMPNLKSWEGELNEPGLGLLDVSTATLQSIPKLSIPDLMQFSLHCSLNNFPETCDMNKLESVFLFSSKNCPIDKCLKSHLKKDILIEIVINFGDEDKEKSYQSKATKKFYREMEKENKKMQDMYNMEP